MTQYIYIVLFILVGLLTSCEKATLPEPIHITPDESTFYVDFLRNGEDNAIAIGFEDFIMEPDFEKVGDLYHYQAIFKKSDDCNLDCQERLVITIIDTEEAVVGNYDPINSLYLGERLYVKPAGMAEVLSIFANSESNYYEALYSTTLIDNYEDLPIISEGATTEIVNSGFFDGILSIFSVFTSENGYWNCNSFSTIDPHRPSPAADIEIALHEPDSNFVTITASESAGAQIDDGLYVLDTFMNCSTSWNQPLVIELSSDICNRAIELTTFNDYENFISRQIRLNLNHNTGKIYYCVVGVDYEISTVPVMANTNSKVMVDYTDANGVLYSSTLTDGNGFNKFNIISVDDFSPYHNGLNTLKLDVDFSVQLKNNQGDVLEITNALGTIAVAYPEL